MNRLRADRTSLERLLTAARAVSGADLWPPSPSHTRDPMGADGLNRIAGRGEAEQPASSGRAAAHVAFSVYGRWEGSHALASAGSEVADHEAQSLHRDIHS